jgi:riboflavin kinase/FMN adenylyltransferase
MQLFHSFIEIERPVGSVCTVGTFDGVHLGHQALLRALVDDAHTRGVSAAVVTFFPHPRVVLGRSPATYLTLPDEKARQMQLLGVDILVVISFTRDTIQISAAEFVRRMLDHLRLASLWIGPDFALGNKRQGDAAFLSLQGAERGFAVNVLAPVNAGIESVSSTRIRAALARGDMREAKLCLGRPFQAAGTMLDPVTIRISPEHALPAPGVYPVLVCGGPYTATLLAPSDAGGDAPDAPHVLRLDHPVECERNVQNASVVEFT